MIKIYPLINTNPTNNSYYYSTPYYQGVYPTRNHNSTNFTIKVTGKGEVSVKPDQAKLILGIAIEDMNVQNAQQQNAIISNKIIDALKGIGIKQEEIETTSYIIERIVDSHDSQQVFRGYRVNHIMQVTVKDLSYVGRVIDVATENGANVVRDVTFEVSNPEPYYAEALQKATLNAKYNAENIANVLGLSLNSIPVWLVEESVQLVRPQFYSSQMSGVALSAPTTPIHEGQVKINASVQALFNYGSF